MNRVPVAQRTALRALLAEALGLHFPPERWDDLQRGLVGATQEFGFEQATDCVHWLLSAPPSTAQIEVLASHLTIGETYFFRDKPSLALLAETVLPELIRSRRGRGQRLRLWSAACCSGEEAYTLAMLLHHALPDLADWQITITATDINPHFLRKAAAGVYGEWSFRDVPASLKQRYFTRTAAGRYAIVPEIQRLVRFAHLNLADDAYPSTSTDTHAMDVILCRNVLMYFGQPQLGRVVARLHQALADGGWLIVSPSETSQTLFSRFVTVNSPDAIIYRKDAQAAPAGLSAQPQPQLQPEAAAQAPHPTDDAAAAPAALIAAPPLAAECAPPTAEYALLARALANRGELTQALQMCERWVAADKMNPAAHYLRAVVLLEQDEAGPASAALQRALFLEPDFVLAHYTLGNLARARGRNGEAGKHFANALTLLHRLAPEALLPESDGLSAGRLAETLTPLIGAGAGR